MPSGQLAALWSDSEGVSGWAVGGYVEETGQKASGHQSNEETKCKGQL